jgi:hypothetical protein
MAVQALNPFWRRLRGRAPIAGRISRGLSFFSGLPIA